MAINLGTIFAQIGLNTTLLERGVKKANAQLLRADRSIGGFVKRNEKKLLTFGAAGAGAVLAIGVASVKMAGDFDQAMRNVNTITKLSEKQFTEMKEEVIDLSKEIPLTAEQLAAGLFQVASAGVEAGNQINFLAVASRAAVAGQADLSTTVKGITGVIKGYGDSFENADRIADLFFKTNELGVTTFEELAGSMGKVVPLASSLGVTQEELFASMSALTGVTGNTSEVVTQLKAAFTNLIKPSKEAQEIASELGISFDATSIQSLGLKGFLEQLQGATGGNVETMAKLFGSTEGLGAILALTGDSSKKFSDDLDSMADSAGAASDAFSEQQKGLNNQLNILKNNFVAIALDLGGKIIPKLTEMTTTINELDDSTKDNIATTAEWTAAIIGTAGATSLLIVGISRLLKFVGTAAGTISAAVAAPIAFTIAMDKLSDTVGNKWVKAVLEGLSPVQTMVENFSAMSRNIEFVKDGTINWSKVLVTTEQDIKDLTGAMDDTGDSIETLIPSIESEKIALNRASEALKEKARVQALSTEAIREEEEALEDLATAIFKTFLFNTDLAGSLEASETAFDNLKQAEKEFGAGSVEANKALQDLVIELNASALIIPDIINKVGALTEEEVKFLLATQDNIDAVETLKGVNNAAWDDISNQITAKINTQIIPNFSKMRLEMIKINDTRVDPEIKADTSRAEKSLNNVIGLISRIRSKTVTINTIISSNRRPGSLGGFEKGGLIRGFANGGLTSDRTVMVGERGPELATLPLGTRITPNNQIGQALDSKEPIIIHLNVKSEIDGEKVFEIVQTISNKEDFRRIL